MKFYLVQHTHVFDDGHEDIIIIGIYSTNDAAIEAITRAQSKPGFQGSQLIDPEKDEDYSEMSGFYIEEYVLNKDYWTEGFVTVKHEDL